MPKQKQTNKQMKTIAEYLNGAKPGDIIPAIKGAIIKSAPPNDKEIQYITIGSKEESIKLAISKARWVDHPKTGNILSLSSTGDKRTPSKGLILKENSKNGLRYISVMNGALIEQQESVTESVEESEPLTASDHTIDSYIWDRLYIYKRAEKVIERFNLDEYHAGSECKFPTDKIPEIATAVHIELSRRGIAPRPSEGQERRKEVHKTKKETPTPKESPKSNWREFKNPVSGVLLGREDPNKIKTEYLPWSLRQDPESLKPEARQLYDMVNAAIRELGITASDSLNAYLLKYIKEYEPRPDKRNGLLAKFGQGLEQHKLVKDSTNISEEEAEHILRKFRGIWVRIMETNNDD